VLDAPGLFRLDTIVALDNARVILRNLCGAPMALQQDGYSHPVFAQGEVPLPEGLRVGHHQLAFTLGEPGDAVDVKVVLATLRIRDRGVVRITGQAMIARAG